MPRRNLPLVSVLITAHNERDSVPEVIGNIAAQSGIQAETTEIVVVDDRSTDNLLEALAESKVNGVRYFRIDTAPGSKLTCRQRALDLGFEKARGEFVFVMDADGIATRDWISHTLEIFRSRRADAVAGPIVFQPTRSFIGALQTVDAAFYLGICRLLNRCGAASGVFFSNFAIRRETYMELGGNEKIGFAMTEDLAFARRLHREGKKLVFQNSRPTQIKAAASFSDLIRRCIRVSAGGFSLLALVLGLWVISLPAAAAGALIFKGWFSWLFVFRYLGGIGLNTFFLGGRFTLTLIKALVCYEFSAVAIGAWVTGRLALNRKVHWGGVTYNR